MYTKEQISKEYLKGKSLRYSESKNVEVVGFINSLSFPSVSRQLF